MKAINIRETSKPESDEVGIDSDESLILSFNDSDVSNLGYGYAFQAWLKSVRGLAKP